MSDRPPSEQPTPDPTVTPQQRADELLSAATEAFAGGVGSHAERWVQAGRFCQQYIRHRRFVLGHSRRAATSALRGRLAEHADRPGAADPNRLAQVAAVVDLLSEGNDGWMRRRVAWGKLQALQALAVRDDAEETYTLRSGVDVRQARALFAAIVGREGEPGLPLADVRKRVAELLGEQPVKRPGRPASTPPAEQPRVMPRIAPQPADARELAAAVVELVRESEAPDDFLEEVLALLAHGNDLSRQAKRAVQAALLLLHRDSTPSPAEVADAFSPNRNGHFHHTTS